MRPFGKVVGGADFSPDAGKVLVSGSKLQKDTALEEVSQRKEISFVKTVNKAAKRK